jgi:outer membrane protein assembly factor BamB
MKQKRLAVMSGVTTAALLLAGVILQADWPEWRGPNRDGTSPATNLPSSWSPDGDNLAWKLPIGSRSTPVVFGDRLYLYTNAGSGDSAQERLVAVDVNSGKVVWERFFNVFLSDVPAHRVGWASPAVDTATGNIYTLGVGGLMNAVSPEGDTIWHRSLTEDYGFVTTHGGRTVAPIIEGDLVIIHGLCVGWGDLGRGGNRWFAFDKRTGETVWVSSPQKKHYDTNMSPPIVTTINGMKLMIVGGTDGTFHAMQVNTGVPVWDFEFSKRAILTGAVMNGTTALLTHSEENLDTNQMGMIAAVDATGTGTLTVKDNAKWFTHGFQGGFSSPVTDGERLYQIDNGAVLAAFDLSDGHKLWEKILGTIQKGSLVLADGKLYAGTENGKFYILEPSASGVKVLDEDWLGPEDSPPPIIASPAVSDGRVFVSSMDATYAIGKDAPPAPKATLSKPETPAPSTDPATVVQVLPYEVLLAPGETASFTVRLFDAKGRFIREASNATWALDELEGAVKGGTFTAAPASADAGYVKATVDGITGQARVRVIPPLPWSFDFNDATGEAPPDYWINTARKLFVRDLDGEKVLVRVPDATPQRRTRVFMGSSTLSDYTIEADVRVTERRRQLADAGVFAQRYGLVLFGNSQKVELQPWQAAPGRTVTAPFAWKPDTWYRLKLQVQNQPDGVSVARGKVWPRGEAEPSAWLVEKTDKIGHREGSPGLYADPTGEVYFDNLKVTGNQ